MRFDFIIGNPPYQESRDTTKDMPIYNDFMDAAFDISDRALLITPGRFLFNAGATPKTWNKKMLSDPHFKIVDFSMNSSYFFPNTNIMGGIAISYRDVNKDFGAIEVFSAFPELNSIAEKIKRKKSISLNTIMYPYSAYTLSDVLWKDFPERKKRVEYIAKNRKTLSKEEKQNELSNLRIITTNIFDLLSDLFYEDEPNDGNEYVCLQGRQNNERCNKYILKKYINLAENYDTYKVFMSKADGAAGQIGSPIPARIVGYPTVVGKNVGYTQTFQSIGAVKTKQEAEAIRKYICTKFVRAAVGILKITQDYAREKWEFVPIQNFTLTSDIDWSKSISEVDEQLYKKYGLSKEEIAFIEKHVKEME